MLLLQLIRGEELDDDELLYFEELKTVMIAENIARIYLGSLEGRRTTKKSYEKLLKTYARACKLNKIQEIKEMIKNADSKSILYLRNGLTKDQIAQELFHADLASMLPGIDEYVDAEAIEEIANITSDLRYDTAGLVFINDSLELTPNGVIYKSRLLFYHQFLRRFFVASFADIPQMLKRAVKDGLNVRVHLDPLRITETYHANTPIEADHWYGAKFKLSKLNDKYYKGVTVHERGIAGYRLLNITYQIDKTVFYVSNYDNGIKEIQIEELIPIDAKVGIGKDYVLHRFAHVMWNSNDQVFSHLDCSVLAYAKADHLLRIGYEWKPKNNEDIKGKRIKLFRLDGSIGFSFMTDVLYSFFQYNEMIQEFFTGENFADSQVYKDSALGNKTEDELLELDKILAEYKEKSK